LPLARQPLAHKQIFIWIFINPGIWSTLGKIDFSAVLFEIYGGNLKTA
jgi:hypothetical protein